MAADERNDVLAPELMARVSQIQVRTFRLVNDVLSGAYRSTFRGSGIEFEEVRPYQPGDDVRSIDWNRTARAGEPYVKTYVEERELTLMFLVDTSLSMDFGSRDYTKREIAAQFCALLSYVALRQQDRVGLCLFGDEPGLHLLPRKGAGSVARVVREVIAAPPTIGRADFKAVVEEQERTLRRRSLVFVVSDFLDVPTEAADEVARLGRRHDVVCVRVYDPFEEELPAAGRLALTDVERGGRVEVDTRSARVRAEWAERSRLHREAFAEFLKKARADRIDLSTTEGIADPVVRFFHQRRARAGGG